MNTDLIYEDETYAIRGAIYEVYKSLGTGYLEEVCQNALEEELTLWHMPFVAKKALKVRCKGVSAYSVVKDSTKNSEEP